MFYCLDIYFFSMCYIYEAISWSKLLKAGVPAIDVNSYGIWTFGSNVGIYKNLSYMYTKFSLGAYL